MAPWEYHRNLQCISSNFNGEMQKEVKWNYINQAKKHQVLFPSQIQVLYFIIPRKYPTLTLFAKPIYGIPLVQG